MGFHLGEHQRLASAMIDWSESLGLGYEAGTGKTMCILDHVYRMVARGDYPTLVVCPASLVGSWEKAIDKMALFDGYTDEGIEAVRDAITVRSFQKTYTTKKRTVHHRDGRTSVKKSKILRPDIDHTWKLVAVDESHGIGSHSSAQSLACKTLGQLAERRVAMSGTPLSGGGGGADWRKLYGQIRFLDPAEVGTWTSWKSRYVASTDPWGNPYKYNVQACEELFDKYFIVARLRECYDMPDYTESMVPCELIEKTAYADFKEHKVRKYGLDIDSSGGIYPKMLQLCSGSVKNDDNVIPFKTSKLKVLDDIIDGTDDKVIIFCKYRASIDRVESQLSKREGKTVVYDGRAKGETWRELQEGDAQYLICQYQSGGTGIDLYASSTMIFFEPCFSSLILEQTKARIMRKGQTRKCRYLYLYTPGTIEEKAWSTVMSGVTITRKLLDEWESGECDTV